MAASFWESFTHDPRSPEHAGLRASDADRDVVHRLLGEAFADGRLDRDEHDRRSGDVLAARTLGDLPPLVTDLVRDGAPVRRADPGDARRSAEQKYAAELRNAWAGFVTASLVCWVIWWLTTGGDGFAWPAIVSAVTFAGVVRTRINREATIAREERRLQRRRDELRGLPPGETPAD